MTCPICAGELRHDSPVKDFDGFYVDCVACGPYQIDRLAAADIRTARRSDTTGLLQLRLARAVSEAVVRGELLHLTLRNWRGEADAWRDAPAFNGRWWKATIDSDRVDEGLVGALELEFDAAWKRAEYRARAAMFRSPVAGDGSVVIYLSPVCTALRGQRWFQELAPIDVPAPAAAGVEFCAGDKRTKELLQ